MNQAIVLVMIGVLLIVFGLIGFKSQNSVKTLVEKEASILRNKYDKVILFGYEKNNEKLNYAGFDNSKKELKLRTKGNPDFIIKYEDIENVELIENNKTTLSLKNIALGGAIAGGVGMILGGMEKKEKVISRKIKFTLNDFDTPSYIIDLINNGGTKEYGIDVLFEANKLIDTIK